MSQIHLFPMAFQTLSLRKIGVSTSKVIIIAEKADFGVAFDGDFDRCFLFDHLGNFIPGEYIIGLLAELFLGKEGGAKIVHDPRIVWNTIDVVKKRGGYPVSLRLVMLL